MKPRPADGSAARSWFVVVWFAVVWLVVLGLLAPALALSVVRLVPLDVGVAIRLTAFVPLALPLYAVALVLLLGLLGQAWRRATRRGTPAFLAVAAVVGLALHGWWAAPAWLGDTPAAAGGATALTVMTANLFEGAADPADLVRIVRAEGVEVLVLEEVSEELLPVLDADGLGDLLPHRIGAPGPADPVAGTMVLSTLPLGTATRVDTYHQSWLVDVGEGQTALTLLAVHPVSPVDSGLWRAEHATLLATAERARPDLVVGDLNATSDHRPLRALDAAGFSDAARLADSGWQPTWPASGLAPPPLGPAAPPVVAIDHVLLGGAWTALSTHTREVAHTDHLALVAEVARR